MNYLHSHRVESLIAAHSAGYDVLNAYRHLIDICIPLVLDLYTHIVVNDGDILILGYQDGDRLPIAVWFSADCAGGWCKMIPAVERPKGKLERLRLWLRELAQRLRG